MAFEFIAKIMIAPHSQNPGSVHVLLPGSAAVKLRLALGGT